jgi:hypothetical protein
VKLRLASETLPVDISSPLPFVVRKKKRREGRELTRRKRLSIFGMGILLWKGLLLLEVLP